jgi:dephospho-CoA kinase
MLVGLTGSFGSGKSTVSTCFKELGASVLDADAIIAEIYANDADFLLKLKNRFGDSVFNSDGTVDRKALGSRVFSNADELLWLEKKLHPRVLAHRLKKVAEDPNALWIAEIPLLFEKNLEKDMDRSISVVSCYSLRVARLKKRGFSPEEVEKRNSLQLPQIDKISRADFVILNDGSFEFLKRQVKLLFDKLTS